MRDGANVPLSTGRPLLALRACRRQRGAVVRRSRTEGGRSLVYREPEGLAVYRHSSGQMRLFMGFASRSSLGSTNRYANLYSEYVTI